MSSDRFLTSKKRTYEMFKHDTLSSSWLSKDAEADQQVLTSKLGLKIKAQYSKLDEIPDISLDMFKRRKLLNQLGVSLDAPSIFTSQLKPKSQEHSQTQKQVNSDSDTSKASKKQALPTSSI